MLKVIVKTINVVTAAYVVCMAAGTIYGLGKEAGKREAADQSMPDDSADKDKNPVNYKVVDGVLYERVK